MRVLVTGGAGFIGSHLVSALSKEGHAVVILDNFNDFYAPSLKLVNVSSFSSQVKVVEGDICCSATVGALFTRWHFDSVVHLAAYAGVRPSVQYPTLYLKTNVDGTLQLLKAAHRAGVPKFLFGSSSSVYGLKEKVPFSEGITLSQTLNPYAASKLVAEQLCRDFACLHGIHVVCLRFFTVYGPAQRPDLAIYKFTQSISREVPIQKFGDGTTQRDYTYVDDVIQGILKALYYKGEVFEVFNLGKSSTTTLNELIVTIEEALGKKALIRPLSEQNGDMPYTCADVSKARRLLGYQPQISIPVGIKKFVSWYLEKVQ
ncbi:UDP-glucose 4-epimerase [Candidatus Xiphinematobacter sp. Idaho Grape]|uniref:NAD-dependent epimerase/dehydratase family protein n=1 Tax=Candidatus Xiphinematobacter sp. Idaho Grape TaxID=1704307 RepID=UPI000706B527|nr:NAD-dependent epimerase/dehydratase family protein [Candidatus Xiphinematobacter sp. Idaho Grape]ALJ56770.1 UDP-glucose 4-epimerase [Candidatus Xiphinematobacter sp. Idaho Grape]